MPEIPEGAWAALAAILAGAATHGYNQWQYRRRHSGSVDFSDARVLWEQTQAFSQALQVEIARLQEANRHLTHQIQKLEQEILQLRHDISVVLPIDKERR